MSRKGILDSIDLSRGVDIASSLDLKYQSNRERRKTRIHLSLMLITAIAALGNFLPNLQLPAVWIVSSISTLLLARTFPTLRSALHRTQATKASALQIQSLLGRECHGDQVFAFKVSKFQPRMRLRVATISNDNRLCIRTYSVEAGKEACLEVEDRQVYVKRWLNRNFGEAWSQLALDRRISTPRARSPKVRFGTATSTTAG